MTSRALIKFNYHPLLILIIPPVFINKTLTPSPTGCNLSAAPPICTTHYIPCSAHLPDVRKEARASRDWKAGAEKALTARLSSVSPDFPGTPSLLRAQGEVFGSGMFSPVPALLLAVVGPADASSAPVHWSGCLGQADGLTDFGENLDAVSSQSGVCKLLTRKYAGRNMQ